MIPGIVWLITAELGTALAVVKVTSQVNRNTKFSGPATQKLVPVVQ